MKNLKLVSFDLDNTLWDVDSVILEAEKDLKKWMAINVPQALEIYTAETLAPIRDQVALDFPNQIHDLSFMRQQVLYGTMKLSGLPDRMARDQSERAFAIFFEARNRVKLYPGAEDMLSAISKHFPLWALTNGNADIVKAGLGHYFSGAISSADVGAKKPDPKMFNTLLTQQKLKPNQVVHIGDNIVDDVHGASQIGIKTIWINFSDSSLSSSDTQPDAQVQHLSQVHSTIEKLAN